MRFARAGACATTSAPAGSPGRCSGTGWGPGSGRTKPPRVSDDGCPMLVPAEPMPSSREPRRSLLADGREILYFDDPGAERGTPTPDPRHLAARPGPSELRHDRLTDEPVIVAAARQDRTFLP